MTLSALEIKLTAVDAECETSSQKEIDSLYKEVRYDGSRLRHPSLQEVAGVWLKLIREKEKEFIAEIKRFLDAIIAIDEDQLSELTVIVESKLQDDQYMNRLEVFAEGVARKASSYGVAFSQKACRFDLADAAYRAGLQNLLRAARKNIFVELQLYFSSRGSRMGFSSLMTDTVSILKKNGNRFDGIKASVQTNKIFISGSTLLIESGDLIQRRMSNGGEETFEVIDPGFHEKFHSIPVSYQMTVKKLGIPEAQKALQNITYNITGANARINQNSIDNSTNVVTVNPDAIAYIEALRSAIQGAAIGHEERQSAVAVIDAVEGQFQSGRPSKPVVTALLAALPHAANVATIVTSLIGLF